VIKRLINSEKGNVEKNVKKGKVIGNKLKINLSVDILPSFDLLTTTFA